MLRSISQFAAQFPFLPKEQWVTIFEADGYRRFAPIAVGLSI
jgi:hypothetical protein